MIGPYGPNHTAALLAEGASCTIYVGNLNPSITAEQLNQFFSAVCGQVLHVRMAGDDPATAFRFDRTRFAFVQFLSKEQADIAMTLSGTILGGLPIKCGPAKNPIVQPRSVLPSAGQAAGVDDSALEQLKAAQERIAAKISAKTQKSEEASAGQGGGRRSKSPVQVQGKGQERPKQRPSQQKQGSKKSQQRSAQEEFEQRQKADRKDKKDKKDKKSKDKRDRKDRDDSPEARETEPKDEGKSESKHEANGVGGGS
ncbi:hypothetical protein GUITHDRAFT_118030 [Guillardia theta CCMP2712]|uniref:RRM domain-containing protein n=1 Tax=Guillardia theta (strain CCMP2712) TaxID=905079 RepID=L1IIW6_GUITC|nr:hypothetical protein GUITHDRAFT_118030 [Guillardia theta CCMP2712]EKX35755.1 hypothetical protein GUITHDRAFT_118030 [Guillardia theta CCMP2712]|eukprot:XP_005822735.1 hypothetical protein GUITHDRAFT_118030 [Guillardia theta CCMP2712]